MKTARPGVSIRYGGVKFQRHENRELLLGTTAWNLGDGEVFIVG